MNRIVKRALVIQKCRDGKKVGEISKELKIPHQTVSNIIKRFQNSQEFSDKPRSGRPRSARSRKNIKAIKERIQRDPRRSMRKMARDLKIDERSVRNIVKKDLKLKPIKFQSAHVLTDAMKKQRLEKCRSLLKRLRGGVHLNVLWSDEAPFSIEQEFNKQNDRILSPNVATANQQSRIVQKSSHPKSLMVWGGITADGKTPLFFVKPGVKIDQKYYQDEVLTKGLTPWAQKHFSGRNWIFQQDSAPAHRARSTIHWLNAQKINFITPDEWPSNSPDINPMDFAIWGILKSKVLATPHKSLDALKRKLIKEWDAIPEKVLRAAVDDVPKRLRACIREKGGYFEF